MEIRILKPRKALNNAFLKVKPTLEIETYQLVYQLYNLTPEEIAIIENSIKYRPKGQFLAFGTNC